MAEVDTPVGPQDWRLTDREGCTATWNRANVLNLMRGFDGAKEYQTIRQRTMFYGWFDQIREIQGHEILWPACAYIVAGQMASLENPLRTMFMTTRRAVTLNVQSSQRIIDFGKAGNKAIFDDVFPKLKRVFERGLHGKKIVGTEAADWDAETLHNEQFTVVQPIYLTYAGSDKDMQDELKALASGSDIFWLGGVAIGHSLDFTGDIMSPTDRYNHGSQKVAAFYKKFKQAIESARTNRQVSRPDPSAGGMVRAG